MPTSIVERAQRRNATIVFVDEAGFMLSPTLRRTWAPRGQTPIIRVAEPHGRISVIGAICISPVRRRFSFWFQLSKDNENFRGDSLVAFLNSLRKRIRKPITLLWDQIAIHHSRPVQAFLNKHRSIVIELFPPYAPELNPVDLVWAYVKHSRLGNYTPNDLTELRWQIIDEFERIKRRQDLLKSFFIHTGLRLEPISPGSE
jgi:transposase